jgi:hypothetical protein
VVMTSKAGACGLSVCHCATGWQSPAFHRAERRLPCLGSISTTQELGILVYHKGSRDTCDSQVRKEIGEASE